MNCFYYHFKHFKKLDDIPVIMFFSSNFPFSVDAKRPVCRGFLGAECPVLRKFLAPKAPNVPFREKFWRRRRQGTQSVPWEKKICAAGAMGCEASRLKEIFWRRTSSFEKTFWRRRRRTSRIEKILGRFLKMLKKRKKKKRLI